MTKSEAADILLHHSQDEANYIYRDVVAEMGQLMTLPIKERCQLISDFQTLLDGYKFRTENERCIRL